MRRALGWTVLCLAAPAAAGDETHDQTETMRAMVARLGDAQFADREEAFELLFIRGDDAVPALATAAASKDPEIAGRAKRLLFLIRWRMAPALWRRLGPLWDDFEAQPFRGRIRRILELESLREEGAVKLLRRVQELDPNPAVREQARISLARLVLVQLNMEGCRLMAKGLYDEAEAKFQEILALDGGNALALYNLACAKSLRGDVEGALEFLRQSIRNGYRDFRWAREDPDLENARQDPRFERILREEGAGD